jgi:excisionase family DNA binding protein
MRKPTTMMIEPTNLAVLTPIHLADLLHVEPRTIRKWLHEGALVGVRLPGGDWRVLQADCTVFCPRDR